METNQALKIPSYIKVLSDKLLKNLIASDSDVQQAILSTEDGFEIAAAPTKKTVETAKLAAVASSLSALSSLSITETNLGTKYETILIESDKGYFLVMDILVSDESFSMILNIVVAPKTAVLGKIIYHTKILADSLSKN